MNHTRSVVNLVHTIAEACDFAIACPEEELRKEIIDLINKSTVYGQERVAPAVADKVVEALTAFNEHLTAGLREAWDLMDETYEIHSKLN